MSAAPVAKSPDSPLMQIVTAAREQPVVYDDVRADLCPQLGQVILDRMTREGGRRSSGSLNVGGWKSGEDFFSWADPAVQALRDAIYGMLDVRSMVAWAMVNWGGSRHPRHQHPIASLSLVYYVIPGDPLVPTIYECPCDGRRPTSELVVDPRVGRLVAARGQTWHRVDAYNGDTPRVTIAIDVRR